MMGQANPLSGTSGSQQGESATHSAQRLTEQAKNKAGEAVDAISAQASELAGNARDALMSKVNEKKGVGAEYVAGVADVLRRVAGEFDRQLPFAATYVRAAADQVDNIADGVRSGDPSQLVRDAQRFAREQPTLVAGMAMLAGFGVMRLIKNANASGQMQGSPSRPAGPTVSGRSDWGRS